MPLPEGVQGKDARDYGTFLLDMEHSRLPQDAPASHGTLLRRPLWILSNQRHSRLLRDAHACCQGVSECGCRAGITMKAVQHDTIMAARSSGLR